MFDRQGPMVLAVRLYCYSPARLACMPLGGCGAMRGHGLSDSSCAASATSCDSPPGGATSWTPIGSPLGSRAAGTDMVGNPARSQGPRNGVNRIEATALGIQPRALQRRTAGGSVANIGVISTSWSAKKACARSIHCSRGTDLIKLARRTTRAARRCRWVRFSSCVGGTVPGPPSQRLIRAGVKFQ